MKSLLLEYLNQSLFLTLVKELEELRKIYIPHIPLLRCRMSAHLQSLLYLMSGSLIFENVFIIHHTSIDHRKLKAAPVVPVKEVQLSEELIPIGLSNVLLGE